MKYAITALLLILSSYSLAQKPEWPPVAELILEGLELPDLTKLNHSYNRCAALYIALERITKIDSPELGERFGGLSEMFFGASTIASLKVAIDRGNTAPDKDALIERNLNATRTFAENYIQWFDSNYIKFGSYFEKDPFAEMEIESCGQLVGFAEGFIVENADLAGL